MSASFPVVRTAVLTFYEDFENMVAEAGGEGSARLRINGWPEDQYMVVRWMLGNWVQGDLYNQNGYVREAWLFIGKHLWECA